MPTVQFKIKDLNQFMKSKLSLKEIKELLPYAKAEFEKQDGDEISIKYNDTNQPYLWSLEGLARFFQGIKEEAKGVPKILLKKSKEEVIVDKSVNSVRPFIACFIAKGKPISEDALKQLIQLQEKICDNYGRRRQKIAIGIYPSKKITFPVVYKAVDPKSVSFIPLEFTKPHLLDKILEEHPKGKEYAWILKDFKKYPVLVDAHNHVLSFPPIINSNDLGKVELGETELFFEATGTDLQSVLLACSIFSYALYDRGYGILAIKIKYPDKSIVTPELKPETIKIRKEDIQTLLGISLKDSEIKHLLEKARYGYSNNVVSVPPYRQDIMHVVDVIEDVAIMFGYDKIEPEPLRTQTRGDTFPIIEIIDSARELLVGLGYQEIWSAILSNKKTLYDNMQLKDFGTVEISEYLSENFSVVRSWLLPIVLEFLSKNKHVDFPQKVFEQGTISRKSGQAINDREFVSFASSHANADFTEIKQAVDFIMRSLHMDYVIKDTTHSSFIQGRVGEIIVHDKKIGVVGEIHPKVLNAWGLEMPVAACEIDISELFNLKE
ncbi:phenylalanine--tRNA ligase subunit beta [Candidatus Woesearchaeota archaeon]|nr:phenylalanine--tRNA ligase subunit beta [Candidatus Woesearchaeota archaeon]